MPKIFVSYRRDDTIAVAGRIGDRLRSHYDRGSVYIDVDTTPPGVDFRDHIVRAVQNCDVVLVLIGNRWVCGDTRVNRLDDPADFVRIEVEAALARNIPVIPVLVGEARMPVESDLPVPIRALVYRNAVHVDHGPDFHHHMDRIIRALNDHTLMLRPQPVETRSSAPGDVPAEAERRDASAEGIARGESRAGPNLGAGGLALPRGRAPNLEPIRLTLLQGVGVTLFLLVLNSILAALGSMLWGEIHYWPAFMVYALACANFRYWGVLLAALSPVVSSVLMIGGAPAYLYIPVNVLQAILVILAFRLGRIDPGLGRFRDKMSYLFFGVSVPSMCGAGVAWFSRWKTGVGDADPWIGQYMFWWVLENLTPAILPGIWLHKIIGSLRRPFTWSQQDSKTGWVRRTLEYAAPWTLTLFLSGGITLFLVSGQLGRSYISADAWSRVHTLAGANPVFRWLVFFMCVSILVSVGYAIRHARQAWQLEQAIRRHMPSKEEADRILMGKVCQSERKIVSLMVVRMTNFGDGARALRPPILVDWLNAYFECLMASVTKFGGQVDHLEASGTLVVFGLRGEDCHANSALLCMLDLRKAAYQLNKKFAEKQVPPVGVAIGVHTGQVVSGEVGSHDRRHYTVVSNSVDLAGRIAREARDILDHSQFGLVSTASIKEAGLLTHSSSELGLVESQSLMADDGHPLQLYAVDNPARLEQSLILASQRSV